MTAVQQKPDERSSNRTPVPRVGVSVYSGSPAGAAQAKDLMNIVASGLENPAEFVLGLQSFDVFQDEATIQQAADEARTSGIVIVAAPTADQLPAALGQWFERWLAVKERKAAVCILLLSEFTGQSLPGDSVPGRMQRAASDAGVEFCCERWTSRAARTEIAV